MRYYQAKSVAGFVLAGGQSLRMGSDKALALFAGKPLIQVALAAFDEAGISASIAGSRSNLAAFAEEIPDAFPETGPMGGILSALMHSRAEWNLFLPVDLPCMPTSLLACLLERAMLTGSPVTAARLNGRLEPFPVVLHAQVLPHLQDHLKSGATACHLAWQAIPKELGGFLDCISVESLSQCGQCTHPLGLPPALWFQSANTPEELARLNRIHFDARKVGPLK
jgi:molybdopterin-guanine dinucleotide biosynthesis protein A